MSIKFSLRACAACCLLWVLLPGRSSGAPAADAGPRLSPEAQKAFDVGLALSEEAFVSGKPDDWDAAIDALLRAQELAPGHPPVALRLAAAHQERKRFLAATAWAHLYLGAAPTGEFAKNAREVAEYCSRRAEAQKIKIFAAARSLAEKVPPGRGGPPGLFQMAVTMGDQWEWYRWQRAKLGPHPDRFDTCDMRTGVLEDVRCVQAEAGDFEAFVDEAAFFVAECRTNIALLPHRFESPCWDAFFRSALETKNWPGAMQALRWDYNSLNVPDERRPGLRRWAAYSDPALAARKKEKWRAFAFAYGLDDGHTLTRPRIIEAWTQLALQFSREEREARLEERVQELQAQAQNKQGDPQKIPVELAILAVPLGKGLRRIDALARATDGAAIVAAISPAYGQPAPGLDSLKAALGGDPQLGRARGMWEATALHVAALGSEGTVPFFKLSRLDVSIDDDNRLFQLDSRPTEDQCRAGVPAARDVVKLLLESGADLDARMANGWTPLHAAAAGYSRDAQAAAMVQLLLTQGADVNACDHHGQTPLHLAAAFGNAETVACLLAKGADATALTAARHTPLYEASGGWAQGAVRVRIFELLRAKGGDVNAGDQDGQTPLHIVALYNDLAAVDYLLAQKADVSAATERETETPLHVAARKGRMEVAKRLIAAGADRAAKSTAGKTPAEVASINGHAELADFLCR